MPEQDFEGSKVLFERSGFTVGECYYDEKAFGSWFIEVAKEGLPQQRVAWDGKDGWLIVAVFASTGSWMNKWLGRKKLEQNAEAALEHLEVRVTRDWERQVERERAEYWANYQLEQALRKAAGLWDSGLYSEYCEHALAPSCKALTRAVEAARHSAAASGRLSVR